MAALAAALAFAPARASAQPVSGKSDRLVQETQSPPWWASFEGGFNFSAGDRNMAFDPGDDKLGELDALRSGDDGFEARLEFGKTIDPVWDFKAGLGIVWLGDDSDGEPATSAAEQNLGIALGDLEMGYRPQLAAPMDIRFSGGVRGLAASGRSGWSGDGSDKVGEFNDETWAIGPRVGLDVLLPVDEERGLSLVGSVAGAALFGQRRTTYDYLDSGNPPAVQKSYSESVSIWNVDVSAGVNKTLSGGANFTVGYKAQAFQNLSANRYDIGSDDVNDYVEDGHRDVLVHGPFLKFTVPLQ
jgi:hypothetical protein